MSKAKKEIEALIEKKIKRKHDRIAEQADQGTVERAVFEFVQRYEEIIQLDPSNNSRHSIQPVVKPALDILRTKIKDIDPGMKLDFGFQSIEGQNNARLDSVTITWSDIFVNKNNCAKQQTINVAELLLRFCM